MVGRFLRASKRAQRRCSRRLPASARAELLVVGRLGGAQLPAEPIAAAVMPGRLDQQPAGVGVTGLGDRSLLAVLAAGGLARAPGPGRRRSRRR